MTKAIIGLDPGINGGIALLAEDAAVAWKMGETEHETLEILRECATHRPCHAFLERVASFPGQGVASTFKFGVNYGFLRACLLALEIPFETVAPGVWQRALGCLSKGKKAVTRARAQELWPHLKITNATADALLIAEFGRRKEIPDAQLP